MIMHGRCAGPTLAHWPKDFNSMAVGSGARMTATATMHNCKANIVSFMNGHA